MRTRPLFLASLLTLAAACGGSPPQQPTAPPAPAPSTDAPPVPTNDGTPPPAAEGQAHKLFTQTNGCWFGGIWSDAEREPPDQRRAETEARCRDVLRTVYSNDDKAKVEQLRAFDAGTIGDLSAKVDSLAAGDAKDSPRREMLVKVLNAAANAQREAMHARRAADRVKRDLDHEPDKLTKDEADAVGPASATKELEALLSIDDPDARAIGYITAMDRIAISRGLPRHLKIYALAGTTHALFGAAIPDLPTDMTKPLKKGIYLVYISDVAKAAGHPVPETAKTPREKESVAWAGVLEGVAERIKANADKLPGGSELRDVSGRIANRLAAWYEAEKKGEVHDGKTPPKPTKK
jgi:hypothetical protein